jgi:CRISPR type IV-associated protein Csf2
MHCADPSPHTIDERGLVTQGTGGNSCTATVQQRILSDGVHDRIPYFPANDLRGRLRRKAANIIMDSLSSRSEKISVELYAALCAGSYNAKPDTAGLTIEEAIRASRHVYMGVFGGGARLIRSGYSVQDAIPIIRATVKAGMVPSGFGEYSEKELPRLNGESKGEGWRLLETRKIIRVDDAMRALRVSELDVYLEDAAAEVSQYQQGVLKNRKDRKEQDEVKKEDIGNMVTVQSIIAGTDLYFHLDLSDTLTPAQVGLVLVSLRDLFNEQALGGWIRAGYGKFAAKGFTITIDGERMEIFTGTQGGYQLAEPVGVYIEAMRREVESLKSADLMEFFDTRKKAE